MDCCVECQWIDKFVLIYEVYLGSWCWVFEDGDWLFFYFEYVVQLILYVKEMGFIYIELMLVLEYLFDGLWGYQLVGFFVLIIWFGILNEFCVLVEVCYVVDFGLIIDWVLGYFLEDVYGFGCFDGIVFYEYVDCWEGFYLDWNIFVYNYGCCEVKNYLIVNVFYWLEEFYIDGLWVDVVVLMFYCDYLWKEGEWVFNIYGGWENLEVIDFFKEMNVVIYGKVVGIMIVVEELIVFLVVMMFVDFNGFGFGFKWNMGWMNDMFSYMVEDLVYWKYYYFKMIFGLYYVFFENFILLFSYDEVVYGKGLLLDKMFGGGYEKFVNLRVYYGFMWGYLGKKLLFMGGEFV